MISFVRTASAMPGMAPAAMTFAVKVAAFLKDTYQRDVMVSRPIGGNPYRVAWSTRFNDLAEMEAFNTKLLADAKYWELVNSGANYFIAGTAFDEIWQNRAFY